MNERSARSLTFVDGVPAAAIPASDRGFNYGDGVFETMRLVAGRVRFLEDHIARLRAGLARLNMPAIDAENLAREIEQVSRHRQDAVMKLVVTRGDGPRGYAPPRPAVLRRILSIAVAPAGADEGIAVRWCETRLARNPALAGIKHLNRLEQVLARSEWEDPQIAEGLMLDTAGVVVCGTASNVFAVIDGVLRTPDLTQSGVAGVMRKQVLEAAQRIGLPTAVAPLVPAEIEAADELFVTNAVMGIRPVLQLGRRSWNPGDCARTLRDEVAGVADP